MRFIELLAAGIFQQASFIRKAAKFAGTAGGAAEEAAAVHDAHAHTRAQRDADQHFGFPVGRIAAVGAHRETIGVVVDGYGDLKALFEERFQGCFPPGRDIDGVVDDAFFDVHHRRNADTDPLQPGGGEADDLCRKIFQGFLQRGFPGEGRDRLQTS